MDIRFLGGDEESGNIFIVETTAEAGYELESHKHEHPHMSILVSGTAEVTIDGETRTLTGYEVVRVPAGVVHSVVAVTAIIWLCIWTGDTVNMEQARNSLRLVPR